MEIVDAHTHAWADEDEFEWHSDGPPGVEKVVYSIEDVRGDMDALGIDRACLVATPIHGPGSPYTRRCLREYPDEFYGILLLDYFADDVDERVAAAFEQENVLGFRFHATGDAEWITSPDLDPFWTALEAQDAPQVQFLLRGPEVFDRVETLAAEHPDVTFVIDHIGQPDPGAQPPDEPPYDAMERIAAHSNTYVKITHTSSGARYPFEDIHPHVRYLLETFGSDRLMWGTDWVYHLKDATPWETMGFLDELDFLSRGDRRDLQGRTFRSLLP